MMKKVLKFCKILVLIIILFCIFSGCFLVLDYFYRVKKASSKLPVDVQIEEEEKVEVPVKNKLSLIMVGDALIHGAVYEDARIDGSYDFKPMLENVKDYIKGYDLAFYNQESILGGSELGLSTYPRFNSPYEVGDAFRDLGFNLVALANNHTLDRGEKAIINSKNYWNQFEDIITAGSYSSEEDRENIKILEKNGISYTLLSYTDLTNGLSSPTGKEYLVNRYDEEKVKEDIASVRDKVDLLMVSMHFGVEYNHVPSARQREIAEYLSSLGVDIVIGHHPHVVQPIEFIGETMVLYSLGNFISAQRGIERLTGLMASVDIVKTTYQGVSELKLENPVAELVYTKSTISGNQRYDFKLYRYSDLTDDILRNYKSYQEKYLNIVVGDSTLIEKR